MKIIFTLFNLIFLGITTPSHAQWNERLISDHEIALYLDSSSLKITNFQKGMIEINAKTLFKQPINNFKADDYMIDTHRIDCKNKEMTVITKQVYKQNIPQPKMTNPDIRLYPPVPFSDYDRIFNVSCRLAFSK